MGRTYNALDTIETAKKFREQLILERDDINSGIGYAAATSWCDDCPKGDDLPYEDEFGFPIHYSPTCCKDDGTFDEEYEPSFKKVEHITKLIAAISEYIAEEK
jgi:hypothetical protein